MINKSFVLLLYRSVCNQQSTLFTTTAAYKHEHGTRDHVSTVCTIAMQLLRLFAACDNACGRVRGMTVGVPLCSLCCCVNGVKQYCIMCDYHRRHWLPYDQW